MLSLNGVSAWIEVDGKELEHYGIEVDPVHNKVTCWIATQEDKCFSVVFRDDVPHRETSLGSFLYLDGSSVGGKILHPSNKTGQSAPVVQSGQILSATSSRSFMFSKLELTDEDEYLNQAATHLGEIEIRICRVQVLDSSVYQPVSNTPSHAKVHERSKKALTHCVSYGKEVQTPVRYACQTRNIDGGVPLATFSFKYRDIGLLQANGIVPKPPPPKKKAIISEEVLDLTIDVKQEPKRSNTKFESEARPAKRIKRESKFIPSGEVIDLT